MADEELSRRPLMDEGVSEDESGTVTQLWTARNEQGFKCRQHGVKEHILLDHEGLQLMVKLKGQRKKGGKKVVDEPKLKD